MQQSELDWLYQQYTNLIQNLAITKDRLEKIVATINAYGGEVPSLQSIEAENLNIEGIISGLSNEMYPVKGTWKEKVLFALRRFKVPTTAEDVANYLLENEKKFNKQELLRSNVHQVIASVMSKMGKDGEIAVDNSSFKNRYSLLEE